MSKTQLIVLVVVSVLFGAMGTYLIGPRPEGNKAEQIIELVYRDHEKPSSTHAIIEQICRATGCRPDASSSERSEHVCDWLEAQLDQIIIRSNPKYKADLQARIDAVNAHKVQLDADHVKRMAELEAEHKQRIAELDEKTEVEDNGDDQED